MKIELNIVGMTCVNCSNAVERAVSKIDGVKSVNVSFASSYGEFVIEDASVEKKIRERILKLGYEIASDYEELQKKKSNYLNHLKNRLFISALFLVIVVYFEMFSGFKFKDYISFVFTTAILFYGGFDFFKNGYLALRNRNYDMNVLVSLGSGSAYLYSVVVLFFGAVFKSASIELHLYFESAAMIITFLLIGKYLEERSKLKADDYITSLLNLTPKKALLVCGDGTTKEILAKEIKVGDIILVKNGMSLPCDGIVVSGGAELDTSCLTGESLPVYKQVGDEVYAGATNTNGFLNIKCTVPNSQNMLSNIIKLLSEAGAKKLPISRVADRVANIFVPTVVAISLITFLIWAFVVGSFSNGFISAVSVLIISCPCALGLATPVAIVCGLSNLAKNGALVKNTEVLEIIKEIKTVIFDKTGTLTQGKISLYETNLTNEELAIVAGVEELSEHLISKAIVEYAKDKDISTFKFHGELQNIAGKGIVANDNIYIGNEALFAENNIAIENQKITTKLLNDGFGVVYIAIDKKFVGYIAISDRLRESSKETVEQLAKQGIASVLLTGDNSKTANFIAQNCSIAQVYANQLPTQKLDIVKEYQSKSKVAFVGDGVNDALSLKVAECGFAMSSGSDIAKSAGDIILVNDDLRVVPYTIEMSRATMQVIKQNLFWAFFYNIICIPIAAGAIYPLTNSALDPAYGALAMGCSSLSVVLNSLRLKFMKHKFK